MRHRGKGVSHVTGTDLISLSSLGYYKHPKVLIQCSEAAKVRNGVPAPVRKGTGHKTICSVAACPSPWTCAGWLYYYQSNYCREGSRRGTWTKPWTHSASSGPPAWERQQCSRADTEGWKLNLEKDLLNTQTRPHRCVNYYFKKLDCQFWLYNLTISHFTTDCLSRYHTDASKGATSKIKHGI